jgi:hypothetical protein
MRSALRRRAVPGRCVESLFMRTLPFVLVMVLSLLAIAAFPVPALALV